MSREHYKRLLTDLGKNVGLEDLAPDEDDYCCLGFDDKIITHIQYNEDANTMMLFAQLGAIDEDKTVDIYPRILKANLFWQGTGGSTIGVDDETREVLMSYQTSISDLDSSKCQELLEGFINAAELWIDTLEAVQKGEPLPKDVQAPGEEATGGGEENVPQGGIKA